MSVLQQTKTALGTDAVLTLSLDKAADAIFSELWQYIDNFEQSFSRFLADSELSRFNLRAGDTVPVSNEFKQLLLATNEMSEETQGLFNPFILPALQRVGYEQSWVDPNRIGPDFSKRKIVSWKSLTIGTSDAHIPDNSAIDSGGIGKGFLLERLAELLATHAVKNYWISLGGDIIARGKMDGQELWEIDIAQALDPRKPAASVYVPETGSIAIATSGVTKRKGIKDGKNWHHIIDPTTGESAQTDIMSATVCLPSAVRADVFASCIVACGSTAYRTFADEHGIEDVMIQTHDRVEIVGNLIRGAHV